MESRRTLVGLSIALVLGLPSQALGAWVVDGHGFGHGVGMSQYGAYGYAKHGASYGEILGHYYAGTRVSGGGGSGGGAGGGGAGGGGSGGVGGRPVGKAGGKIRILLGSGAASVGFRGASRACGERLNSRRRYRFIASSAGVALEGASGDKLTGCGDEGVASSGLEISGFGRYRGNLVAHADGGNLLVINALGIDDYVRGVVANEMPASWPQQALRAQAVAARSYALSTSRPGPFDLYADTRSQVYDGKSSETAATNRAVEATAGRVVTYHGRIATTYYFSTSGGRTEAAQFGFGGGPVPYLRSVKDPYDDISPVHDWRVRLSDAEMEAKLGDLFKGSLRRIEVTETGDSPRIVTAKVIGSAGSASVSGSTLQARLGLRSTWARFKHR
jgi:stage II sporulation protein D